MDIERIEIAANLISGQASPAWRTRANHLFEQLKTIYRINPRSVAMVPPEDYSTKGKYGHARILGPDRVEVQKRAAALLSHFFAGEMEKVQEFLTENVWVAWPNGARGRYASAQLHEGFLAESKQAPTKIVAHDFRVYHYGELNQVLIADLGPIFDAILGLKSAVLVSARIESENIPPVRIMLAFGQEEDGIYKSRNLPLVSPDDAYVASAKLSRYEDLALRKSESFMRAVVLGHKERFKAHAGELCPYVWMKGVLYSQEELFNKLGQEKVIHGNTETTFLGAKSLPYSHLKNVLSPKDFENFEDKVGGASLQAISDLNPELVLSRLGEFNPLNGEVRETAQVIFVVFQFKDRETGHESQKIAGFLV